MTLHPGQLLGKPPLLRMFHCGQPTGKPVKMPGDAFDPRLHHFCDNPLGNLLLLLVLGLQCLEIPPSPVLRPQRLEPVPQLPRQLPHE